MEGCGSGLFRPAQCFLSVHSCVVCGDVTAEQIHTEQLW